MKSIFKKPKLLAQGSRNAFDRSSKRVFHAPFGALLPCMVERVNPGDYVELSPETQTIIEPLAAPAFMRLKEHIDYFFVPYSQLWSPFDNFFTQQDQYRSSSVLAAQGNHRIPYSVPCMDWSFIKGMLLGLINQKDEHGFSEFFGALRLLDDLKYGNIFGFIDAFKNNLGLVLEQLHRLPQVNLFALLAYQKIYFDYYRNPKYEECKTDAYNIDNFGGSRIFTSTDVDVNNYGDWFRMRYRWMKKDYFTSVCPNVLPDSNQIGFESFEFQDFNSDITDVQALNTEELNTNFGVPGAVGEFNTDSTANWYRNTFGYTGQYFKTKTFGNTGVDTLTPARIRLMFAYDRYLRRVREAGGTFDRQMQAIYGISPNDERFGNVIKIGGQTNRLFLKDVVNVSETGDYGLGSLGGNVNNYSQPRSTFKYHCKEAGLIIGIYSTSIDNDYPSFMVDRANTSRGRFDWFTPQFQDLGLQALFRYELNFLSEQITSYEHDAPDEPDPAQIQGDDSQYDLLGYQRRYAEYKSGIDTVHGLFASKALSPELSVWVAKWMPRLYNSDFHVAPLTIENLTYNPSSLNDVTNVQYDGTPQLDVFKIHHYNHFKCISNMSVIGENF